MRVLLYDRHANSYFQNTESWTGDPHQALDFQGTVQAVDIAWKNRLKGVEIILSFEEPGLDLRIPLEIS